MSDLPQAIWSRVGISPKHAGGALARSVKEPLHQCQRPAHCNHYHQRTEKDPGACKQCFC